MFKWIKSSDQVRLLANRQERFASRQKDTDSCVGIAFVALAETGALDDVTATEHAELFSPWVEGISYERGNIRSYEGELYRCVQSHTSQSDWMPDKVPALWSKIGDPTEEFPEWSQPVGAHDAYNKGDKVSFGGKHWESAIDNNVWQPGVYGWDEA